MYVFIVVNYKFIRVLFHFNIFLSYILNFYIGSAYTTADFAVEIPAIWRNIITIGCN